MKEKLYVDELIIGAGLSGLMYGLVAIENNYKVAITESHCKPGGYATSFMREKKKFVFDCSQHKITGLGKNGNLRDAMERTGVWDIINFHFYEELTTIIFKDEFIKIPSSGNEIKGMLIKRFPGEEKGIIKLFNDINSYGYQHYMFGRMMLGEFSIDKQLLPESRYLSSITAKEYFKIIFKDFDIIELISSIAIYLGTLANESNAFYFLHFLYTTFYTRQGYIKGTGFDLSIELANEFKRRGGVLILNNPADKITLSGIGFVESVETLKREIVTNKILATCSPAAIINMLGRECIAGHFLKKLDSLETGWGHFCVYIVCSCPPCSIGFESSEYLLVADQGDDCESEDFHNENYYDKLTLSITNYHKINEAGGAIIQLIILDYESTWFTLKEEEYKKKKLLIQEKLLQRTYRYFPKLKDNLKYIETSTPRTNFSYTSSPNGSAFGYKVKPKTNLSFLNNFPIEGIKLVSGWTAGPGYEAAMCLGFTHAKMSKNNNKTIEKTLQL